jgi:hypothetical protein
MLHNEVLDGGHTVHQSLAGNVPSAKREALTAGGAERTGLRLPVLGILELPFWVYTGVPTSSVACRPLKKIVIPLRWGYERVKVRYERRKYGR